VDLAVSEELNKLLQHLLESIGNKLKYSPLGWRDVTNVCLLHSEFAAAVVAR